MSSAAGLAALVIVGWPAIAAGEDVRVSGTILAVERDAGIITLGEVGPWRVEDGQTRITRRLVRLGPSTRLVLTERQAEALDAAGWPGGFVESPLSPSDLRPGDFVTVAGQAVDRGVQASEVTVVRPATP